MNKWPFRQRYRTVDLDKYQGLRLKQTWINTAAFCAGQVGIWFLTHNLWAIALGFVVGFHLDLTHQHIEKGNTVR